jgi:hypothetical protein
LWKQSVSLPFNVPNLNFAAANVEQVRDAVFFSLFDEFVEDDELKGGDYLLLNAKCTI